MHGICLVNCVFNYQVVGRGYHEDAHVSDPKPSTYAAKARERRKPTKSEYILPLAIRVHQCTTTLAAVMERC